MRPQKKEKTRFCIQTIRHDVSFSNDALAPSISIEKTKSGAHVSVKCVVIINIQGVQNK